MSTATAKKIGEVLGGQGLKTIGALVFWTLSGVRIPRDELTGALEDLDLGTAMVRKPKPEMALAVAIKRVGVGRKGILFRQIGREWGLVVERGEGKKLLLDHVATFRVEEVPVPNTKAFTVVCDRLTEYAGTHLLLQAVQVAYSDALNYCSSADLSAVLCSALQGVGSDAMLGGLSLRQSTGGLYYVSAAKLEAMKRLAAMVNDKSPSSAVEVLTLTGDSENLEVAARNVRGSIVHQLKETREEIKVFVGHLHAEKKSARADSIILRAEQFKQLSGRVELFADVLGESMGELKAQVESARAELMAELEGA